MPIYFIFISSLSKAGIIQVVIALILVCFIFAAIFYTMRRFAVIVNKNVIFQVSDDSLARYLDIDESELNFIQLIGWQRNKSKEVIKIKWNDMKSITDKGHSLLIKSKSSSIIHGSGMMMIPKELENFSELEITIRQKTNLFI